MSQSGASHGNSANDNVPVIRDYAAIVDGALASFVASSRKIGGELTTMIDHVARLFAAQQQFLRQAIQTKKPTNDQQIIALIKPQSSEIEAICGRDEAARSGCISPCSFVV